MERNGLVKKTSAAMDVKRAAIKYENEELFVSTPEYDAEIQRDEHIIEKVRKEREKEGIKEEENL